MRLREIPGGVQSPSNYPSGRLLATIAIILLSLCHYARGQTIAVTKYSFPPPPSVTRSDIYSVPTVDSPRAVVVLCPGMNGNGGNWIREPAWQVFARQHQLGLVGLSFESDPVDRSHGYHYASLGSGQVLLDGIRRIYGRDLPLLLFGFPRRRIHMPLRRLAAGQVLAWCAYSPGEGDDQSAHSDAPPGLIACGEDDSNYGWALFYFKKGRALGKPWLWLSIADTGHKRSAVMEDFVRDYFAAVLSPSKKPAWVDIDEKCQVSTSEAAQTPSESGELPDGGLTKPWSQIHDP